MLYIKYHTGAGDTEAETLEEAKLIADDGAAYTQQDISIEDEDGNEITRRGWCGVALRVRLEDEDCEVVNPIDFGDFGFYDDWSDEI